MRREITAENFADYLNKETRARLIASATEKISDMIGMKRMTAAGLLPASVALGTAAIVRRRSFRLRRPRFPVRLFGRSEGAIRNLWRQSGDAMEKKKQAIWTAIIIRKDRDWDKLCDDLLNRVALVVQFFMGIEQWTRHLIKAKKPPLCLACDFEFKPGGKLPRAFSVAYSLDPDDVAADYMIMTGICDDCLKKGDAELLTVASAGLCHVLDGRPLGFNNPAPERVQ